MASPREQADIISLSDARDARDEPSAGLGRCSAQTATGQRCRNHASEDGLCRVHLLQRDRQQPSSARAAETAGLASVDEPADERRGSVTAGKDDGSEPADPTWASSDTGMPSGSEPTSTETALGEALADILVGLLRNSTDRIAEYAQRRGWHPPVDAVRALNQIDPDALTEALAHAAAFLRRRLTGDYEIDDFGFDEDLTTNLLIPLVRPLHRYYWRVRAVGQHHLPTQGAALVVANHAGTLPADAAITRLDIFEHTGRHARELGGDLVFRTPIVGELARKAGVTLASGDDADRLLAQGEIVAVWPEGYKGLGKRFKDRYKLQRFGRGGFVATALRSQAPIVPTAIVGSEEIWPMVYDLPSLARVLGLPYFPIVAQMLALPVFGPLAMLPLPSKWIIEYGAPIDTSAYGPEAADDPMVVFDLADQVRERIQDMLHRNLLGRRSIWL